MDGTNFSVATKKSDALIWAEFITDTKAVCQRSERVNAEKLIVDQLRTNLIMIVSLLPFSQAPKSTFGNGNRLRWN